MKTCLEMSQYSGRTKAQRIQYDFAGISSESVSGGLLWADNVSTHSLPSLRGHYGFQSRSVTHSAAIYQYLLFPVDDKMYMIAYDGVYLQLFLLYPAGGFKHVFTFPDRVAMEDAPKKVTSVIYCGFDYGDNRGRRVILYPLGYSATVNEQTGELEGFLNLDTYCDFNLFHSAVLHKKRIFGTDGNKIYASKTESVVEFLPSDTKTDEDDPWADTVHHDGMAVRPILGVAVFDGDVYYFCRNSFGRVWGSGNPFRTEQLYSVGTVDFRSVKTLDGKLYFLSENGLMMYDGKNLTCVSTILALNGCQKGVAEVYSGQYYLIPEGQGEVIYTYSPKSESWGCLPFNGGTVLSMAALKDKMYFICQSENWKYSIYATDSSVEGFSFQTHFSAYGSMASDKPIGIRLCADFTKDSSLDAYLWVQRKNGVRERYPLFRDATGNGMTFLSKRFGALSGNLFALELSAKKDVTVYGYEILFEKGDETDDI